MAKHLEIYKCALCGNIVEVMHAAGGTLACCGSNMGLLTENTTEAATEKHLPVIEMANGMITVKVGSVAHPMEENHYIEWVELIADNKVYRQELKPEDAPEAWFPVKKEDIKEVREWCNLHGLWKS